MRHAWLCGACGCIARPAPPAKATPPPPPGAPEQRFALRVAELAGYVLERVCQLDRPGRPGTVMQLSSRQIHAAEDPPTAADVRHVQHDRRRARLAHVEVDLEARAGLWAGV